MSRMITIEKLNFSYPNEELPILNNLNLEIMQGEFLAVIGSSGCGKSTLCMCLNGLIPHKIAGKFQGNVVIDNSNTKNTSFTELTQKVGLVFQNPESQLFTLSVEDELRFGPENLALSEEVIETRVNMIMKELDLEHLKNKSPQELSSGQKQKVALASVLVMQPKILILDEPTANLDPKSAMEIFKIISGLKQKGITIVMVEHDIENVARFADKVVVLHQGKIVLEGKPKEVIADERLTKYIHPTKTCLLAKELLKNGYLFREIPILPEELAHQYKPKRELFYQEDLWKVSPIINIKNLTFSYENNNLVLKDINLTINKGEFVTIVGPNGSGKSTLVLHFNGLLQPTGGEILIWGVNICKLKVSELAKTVGYVFQNPDAQIFEDTVEKEIEFGPKNIGLNAKEIEERVNEALHYCSLNSVRTKDPQSLSFGQKKRVTIASILAMKPQVIIIDEPTTGLDSKTTEEMMTLVRQLNLSGHTIILVTHDMEVVAEYSNRIICIVDGKVMADGTKQYIFSKEDIIRKANLVRPEINRLGNLIGDTNLFKLEEAIQIYI